MKFIKLLKQISLASMLEDRFLTLLSVSGIALGIGLFMGVNVATTKAVKSFEANITGLDSAFNYEIADSSGIDFQEDIYKRIHAFDEKSLPLLSTNASLPGYKESVDINGIYTIKALGFLGSSGKRNVALSDFLRTINGVIITKKFAERHQLKPGDILTGYVYDREYSLKITDIIDAGALPSNIVFMDLGNFQEYFGKSGSLSRIDVRADEITADRIRRVLPGGVGIEKKQQVFENRKSLIDAFRFNLRFVTFLAVLVGVFLLYNTVFISVIKRRREIGILRGLGMDRKTIVALFSAQGLILGFIGSLLGIVFGQLTSWFSIIMVERTVSRFYGSAGASDYFITWKDALSTMILGMAVSFIASLIPAIESANVRPNESAREGTFEKEYKGRQRLFSLIGALSVFSGAGLAFADYHSVPFDFPWLSYAGIILFILGCTLVAPAYLAALLTLAKRPLHVFFKAPSRVAVGDVEGSRYRFSLALMSVAVSSALIVAILSSVFSLKSSFIDWIHTYITADFYVKPASCTSNFCYYPLPDEVVKTIEQLPGVETVGRYRALQLDFQGRKIIAGFGRSDLLWKIPRNVSREDKERLQRLAQYPEVMISDYLKVKYGLKRGDVIELQTPKGRVKFTVNNTSISYSTMSGFLYGDYRWLKEYWGLDDATQLSVYLKKNTDRRTLIQYIEKTLGKKYALDLTDNEELRRSVLRIFDKSFALTYTIELTAIIISLIGVVNALLILVFEKKREISILRYLGASWGLIRKVMILSAGIIGIAGIVLGCVMGSGISVVITHVINKISFGWEVGFRIPFLSIAILMILLFITTLLAGMVPSYLARKIDPKRFISFE